MNYLNHANLVMNLNRQSYGPLDISNVFLSENDFEYYLSKGVSKAGVSEYWLSVTPYPYSGQIVALVSSDTVKIFKLVEAGDIFEAIAIPDSSELQATVNSINTRIDTVMTSLNEESQARQLSDLALQSQIETISSSNCVIDVVATKQDLIEYDTTKIREGSVIKVLSDESNNNVIAYYRRANNSWILFLFEGPFYTKSETDELLESKISLIQDAVENNIPLITSSGSLVSGKSLLDSIPDSEVDGIPTANAVKLYHALHTSQLFLNYGVCETASNEATKAVSIDNEDFLLEEGIKVTVKFINSNTVANPMLDVNNTGGKLICRYGATSASTTSGTSWYAGSVVNLTFDGTVWLLNDFLTDNNTYTSAYCATSASSAAKVASCSGYVLTPNSYLHVIMSASNTAATALTLNVNNKGAKPVYINNVASGEGNHVLPAGSYIVFYNGTNYYFRTDGKLTGSITGDAATVNGHSISIDVPQDAKFTDTTYSSLDAEPEGTSVSLVTTGEKYVWNSKASTATATGGSNGLMSASDKTKLDGVASGATANIGTITGVTMNGSSKGTSGVVDLGTVITEHQDISNKENISNKVTAINESSTNVLYPSAKAIYDAAETWEFELEDGTIITKRVVIL